MKRRQSEGRERLQDTKPSELTLEQKLNLAAMDSSLSSLDLHGKYPEDVELAIDGLLAEYPGEIVRIVYGHGDGVIEREVMRYLNRLKQGEHPKIEAVRRDLYRASCLIKIA